MRPNEIKIGKVYRVDTDSHFAPSFLAKVIGKVGREFVTVDGQRTRETYPARQITSPWGSQEDADAHYEAELQAYDDARKALRALTELGLSVQLTKDRGGYRFRVGDLHLETAKALLAKLESRES